MLCFLREDQNKAPKHCRVMYSLMDRVIKTITEVLPDVDNTVRRGTFQWLLFFQISTYMYVPWFILHSSVLCQLAKCWVTRED
jgi:hypothetical protein